MQPSFLALLDQLESVIARAPALPVSGRILVPRGQLLELLDAMYAEALRVEHDATRPATSI